MKKMLVAIGMMSATCAFGNVFDDCVYLFEGGLDADGNGLFSTGEIRDELHANPSHANNGAVISGYSDCAIFRNEPVPYQSAGISTQNVQCLYMPQTVKVSGTTTNYFPVWYAMPFLRDYCTTNVYSAVFRVRADYDPLSKGGWMMNFGYTKNDIAAGQGWLLGLIWDKNAQAFRLNSHAPGSSGKSWGDADIPTNTWIDIGVVVTGNVVHAYRAYTGRGSPSSGATAGLDAFTAHSATFKTSAGVAPNLTMLRENIRFGGQAFNSTAKNYSSVTDDNLKKYFAGSVRRMAFWNRALTEQEVREAFGRPRPDIVRVGAANGNSDEFASDAAATATVDAFGTWRDFPAVLHAGDTRNVTFPLSANESNLPQLLRIKTLAGGGSGTLRVSVNGTTVASRPIVAGQPFVTILPAQTFVTGANTLTLTRTDANGATIAIDALAVGGSWQVGKNDRKTDEFTYGVPLSSYDTYVNTFAWNRAANAKETGTSALNLYVTVPEEAARYGLHFETRTRNTYALTTTPNTKLTVSANGVTKKELTGLGGSVWTDIALDFEPGELPTGVNNIRFSVTNGGCYYFDYHRFQFVPPPNGTFLIVR